MAYVPKKLADFKIGDHESFTKTITEADVILFAGITGDFNPLHMNEEYAKNTPFKGRIVHGAYVESLTGTVAAQILGMGAIHVSHTMRFPAPTKIGDTVTATLEVIDLVAEKNRVILKCTCTNQHGAVVAEGETIGKIPR
jgi:3-hydroxybutyryl-CoA dehydratase